MFFYCLGASAVLLLIVNTVALATKKGVANATLTSFGFVLLCLLAPSLVVLASALFIGIAGVVCWVTKARPRWFVASSLGATLAGYVLVFFMVIQPELREWERLKADFPLESLEKRLAYEDRPRTEAAPSELGDSNRLVGMEERIWRTPNSRFMRTESLARLHAGVVRQFIDSPGFGVGRHITARPDFLIHDQQREVVEEQEQPIPQPASPYAPLDLASAPLKINTESDYRTIHEDNALDFLNPAGFGYIRSRDQVAGFRPHQFHQTPRSPQRWRIERLDLVGLLKYDTPVVYLSSNFPRMDELSMAPTRPLDSFENEALTGLRRGEDLMVQEDTRHMCMLGSIRALKQCLDCHHAQRGELLGAFSYQMSRDTAEAK